MQLDILVIHGQGMYRPARFSTENHLQFLETVRPRQPQLPVPPLGCSRHKYLAKHGFSCGGVEYNGA